MAYITAQDIVDRYGLDYLQIVSDRNCDGFADLPSVAVAIEDASAEIDKFLSTRFAVPIQDVGTDPAWNWIQRCCADITIYYLAQTWATMTDLIKMRFDDCMTQLNKIANGDINVGGPAVPQPNGFAVCSNERQLTRGKLCQIL